MNNLPGLMQCDGAGGTPQLVATANAATAATSEEHRDRDWYLKQSPAVTQTQQPLDMGRVFASFVKFLLKFERRHTPQYLSGDTSRLHDRMVHDPSLKAMLQELTGVTTVRQEGQPPTLAERIDHQLEPKRAKYLKNFLSQLTEIHNVIFSPANITSGFKKVGTLEPNESFFETIMGNWPLWVGLSADEKRMWHQEHKRLKPVAAEKGRLYEEDIGHLPQIRDVDKMDGANERRSENNKPLANGYAVLFNHPYQVEWLKRLEKEHQEERTRADAYKVEKKIDVYTEQDGWLVGILKRRPNGSPFGLKGLDLYPSLRRPDKQMRRFLV